MTSGAQRRRRRKYNHAPHCDRRKVKVNREMFGKCTCHGLIKKPEPQPA